MKRKEEVSILKATFKEFGVLVDGAQLEAVITEGLKRVRQEKFRRNLICKQRSESK